MKKIYSTLLGLLVVIGFAQANPGDTTWVQANNVKLDYYNDFDTAVAFPDGSVTYRKVLMIFTLGKYACPAGSQYCSQWDYDVHNYVMTPTGDTIELSRLITPFANNGWSRFPSTWQQPYVFDVTDFVSILKNNATSRIHYSGYSGGFTANIKFAFIEGVPERNVTGISKLYDGGYDYGNAADNINNHFPALNQTAPAGTQSAVAKFIITGHGSDTINQCCEFDSHEYDLLINNNSIATKTLWRDNCGINDVYPQGGTWIYDRANWCPGASVMPIYHNLPGITAGSNYDIKLKFEDYTNYSSTKGWGNYKVSGAVIYYGGVNKTLDVSMEDIISPTSYPDHYRKNPSDNKPVIKIRNSGQNAINSVQFSYGVEGQPAQQYTWNGTLASLTDTTISLPEVAAITNLSQNNASGNYKFNVKVLAVNGQADADATNDSLHSNFIVAPLWPGRMIAYMRSGNITADGNLSNGTAANWQGSWEITDMNNNVIASRTNAKTNSTYNDTVTITTSGFYKITVRSTLCMGLHWWPYDSPNSGIAPGALIVKQLNGTNIPMKGYQYAGSSLKDFGEHDDFGCEYSQYFYAVPSPVGVNELDNSYSLTVYPNPASDVIHIDVHGINATADIQLVNVVGQVVYAARTKNQSVSIPAKNLANGIYSLIYSVGNSRKIEKVVIAK